MNYTDRFNFTENQTFGRQVSMALWIAAVRLLEKDPTTEERAWANNTLKGAASTETQRAVMIRVSASTDLEKPQATVSDELIQKIVDALVPTLITG